MDVDDLYGLPLDEFVPERGALAKELRKAGRRDEAADAAGRRKPSVAAWAVNQLVRTQRPAVEELFEAGDELRDAQSDLLAGRGDAHALRAAGDRERSAVEDLVERARGLLSSTGNELSASVIERVSDTLHAAALDEEAREQVRDGRLERELRHVGLGFGLGAGAAPEPALRPPPGPKAKRAKKQGATASSPAARPQTSARKGATRERGGETQTAAAKQRAERRRAAEQRAEAERVRRERAAARRDARAAHASARRRADAAARALRTAEERREQAAKALDEADEALAAARGDAADADAALQRAQAELDAAERKR